MTRQARCRCGQLSATIEGEPLRVSVCHCNACRRATGSAFSAQARFSVGAVTFVGDWRAWRRGAGTGAAASYRWCPACGTTLAYTNDGAAGEIAILLGTIVHGAIPTPRVSMFEDRKLPWVEIVGADVVHD